MSLKDSVKFSLISESFIGHKKAENSRSAGQSFSPAQNIMSNFTILETRKAKECHD